MVVPLQVMFVTCTWTWINIFLLAISILGYYAFIIGYNYMSGYAPEFFGVATTMLTRPAAWLCLLLVLGTMLLVDMTIEHLRLQCCPNVIDVAMELDRCAKQR